MKEARTKGHTLYVYDILEKDIRQISGSLGWEDRVTLEVLFGVMGIVHILAVVWLHDCMYLSGLFILYAYK